MLVTSIFRITGLHHIYGCPTLRAALLGFTSLVGVQPEVQPFIVKSYRITELHYNYGNATLSAHYVGYL